MAPRVGAIDQGADPLATSDATFAHAGQKLDHLGVVVHGAEVRVHFLKSEKGAFVRFFKKKEKKQKKKSAAGRPT
jgi:ribosomal protein L21